MKDVLKKLELYGLIPITELDDAASAVPLAETLTAAGLPIAEISIETSVGMESIDSIHKAMPEFIVGAGAVRTLEQCRAAIHAGAKFIVTPAFRKDLVDYCIQSDVAIIPGCVTPGEIEMALDAGLKIVSYFPATVYGGAAGCKALYEAYAASGISFVPAGGIDSGNMGDYADKPFIYALSGSWLAPADAIREEKWDEVAKIVRASVDKLMNFEFLHVGINMDSAADALNLSKKFEDCFGWQNRMGNVSVFCGSGIEILNFRGRGTMGHLAIRTSNVDRAIFYLEQRGMRVDPESIRRTGHRATFAYMQGEFGGFAIHLIQR